ncbi:MAG: 50S ribosomal protein L25 [Deltaproteobacteria bacterium]|nr:50S ribosomal protein L25 [Deltaproteobacteria bacterium]
MEQINLTASQRQETGKGPARRLRSAGAVPAILYGAGVKDALPLTLNGKELEKVLHTAAGGNVLVNLSLGGDKNRMVMFKQITRHPLMGSLQHVDLLEIHMDHKLVVEVPLHVIGKAEGIAYGGIVSQELRKVRIECLPTQIPDSFDVDVTPLAIGQSLHVKDLKLADGLRAVDDADMTIVSVVAPTAEVAPKTAEEVEAELAKSFEEKEEAEKEE